MYLRDRSYRASRKSLTLEIQESFGSPSPGTHRLGDITPPVSMRFRKNCIMPRGSKEDSARGSKAGPYFLRRPLVRKADPTSQRQRIRLEIQNVYTFTTSGISAAYHLHGPPTDMATGDADLRRARRPIVILILLTT